MGSSYWQSGTAARRPASVQHSRTVINHCTLLLVMLTGCSSGGTRFTLFPERNQLLDSTKAVLQTASPLPLPRELDKRPLPPYQVEPGDVLLVLPAEIELPAERGDGSTAEKAPPAPVRIPADQPILPDGTINLGRYGRVVVAGKTVDEIESLIRATIEGQIKRDPGVITVRIVTRDSKVYYVLGEVNAPGSFQLKGRETVLDAILAAGGLNDRASRRTIILSRPSKPEGCRTVLPICYREIVQLGDTSTNYQIAPGDRIFVTSRTLVEDFCPNKPECAPCGKCHQACPIGDPVMMAPPTP